MTYTASQDTVNIDDLVGPMQLDVPYPIAGQAILWSAIEFCERTLCWGNIQTATVSTSKVSLFPTDDATIADIRQVYWSSGDRKRPLSPVTMAEGEALLIGSSAGTPAAYYRTEPNTLILVPAPDAEGTLSVELLLLPLRSATSLPGFLYDQNWEAIETGAKARLLGQTNRPWADPQGALYYRQQFETLVGTYSACFGKDGTRQPLRSRLSF